MAILKYFFKTVGAVSKEPLIRDEDVQVYPVFLTDQKKHMLILTEKIWRRQVILMIYSIPKGGRFHSFLSSFRFKLTIYIMRSEMKTYKGEDKYG